MLPMITAWILFFFNELLLMEETDRDDGILESVYAGIVVGVT